MATLTGAAAVAALMLVGSACASATEPTIPGQDGAPPSIDATVKMSGIVAAAGVGYGWGQGTLNYNGKDYPFCVRGLSVGDVGIASLQASGLVFHLKQLPDFAGQYVAASMGAALVLGESGAVLKNKHGVTMQLETEVKGIRFNVAGSGLRITMTHGKRCGK